MHRTTRKLDARAHAARQAGKDLPVVDRVELRLRKHREDYVEHDPRAKRCQGDSVLRLGRVVHVLDLIRQTIKSAVAPAHQILRTELTKAYGDRLALIAGV